MPAMASPNLPPHGSDKLPDTPRPPSQAAPSPLPVPSTRVLIAFIIYPLTLIAGSAFAILSPSPASTDSFFSQKRNIVNIFFVKYAWFWTTLVFLLHVSRLRSSSKPKALLRYGLATIWWIVITQWFFGPPIMDRTFLITGGNCQILGAKEEMGTAKLLVTSAACKLAGGSWKGGHDLSGHVFLLTHASLFLWSEMLPVLILSEATGWESLGVLALLALWWWMLLMTGVYFHTWREKWTGWIVASIQWGVLYLWALEASPTVRGVVGVPGI